MARSWWSVVVEFWFFFSAVVYDTYDSTEFKVRRDFFMSFYILIAISVDLNLDKLFISEKRV